MSFFSMYNILYQQSFVHKSPKLIIIVKVYMLQEARQGWFRVLFDNLRDEDN